MKSITKNIRLLIVGAGLIVLASCATGCSSKMGCPGKITLENTQLVDKNV